MVKSFNEVTGWIGNDTVQLFDIAIANITNNVSSTFVELGTYRGKSSICLYDKIVESEKDITLYTIDNWSKTWVKDKPDENNREIFIKNRGNRKINLIESHSFIACNKFKDNSIDFLFIDTNYTYEKLKNEINLWLPKMKKNSIISGHDAHWHGISSVIDKMFPNVSILEESVTHTEIDTDKQPVEWKYSSWYVHLEI